jgi:hypothetical protein
MTTVGCSTSPGEADASVSTQNGSDAEREAPDANSMTAEERSAAFEAEGFEPHGGELDDADPTEQDTKEKVSFAHDIVEELDDGSLRWCISDNGQHPGDFEFRPEDRKTIYTLIKVTASDNELRRVPNGDAVDHALESNIRYMCCDSQSF